MTTPNKEQAQLPPVEAADPLNVTADLTGAAVSWSAPKPFEPVVPGIRRSRLSSDRVPVGTGRAEYDADIEFPNVVGRLLPGTRINQYEIIRELGAGGMGVVYLARDTKLGRKAAIKVLKATGAEFNQRFIAEAQATALCTHENIVVIYEVGEHEGEPFMALEYLEGVALSELRGGSLSHSRIVEIMASVVRALTKAHLEGIVHRDLKPENVFLTQTGAVKVLDFGIAKLVRRDDGANRLPTSEVDKLDVGSTPAQASPTKRSRVSGTISYMAPEQWDQDGIADHRVDIWAVGLTLFELLSGKHPFDILGLSTPVAARRWVCDESQAVPSLAEVAPQLPRGLAKVVDTCLRKDKQERYTNGAALLRALEPFLPGHVEVGPIQIEQGPYAGLRSFQEEDSGRFFGRDREVAVLAGRVLETPLVSVVGPSGVGKSSLLRAGVIPALRARGERWDILVLRPGRDPMLALARFIAPLVRETSGAEEELRAQQELRSMLISEPGYFGDALRQHARDSQSRVLVVVDQLEELYTLESRTLFRRAFAACILGAADDVSSPLRVVTTLRADFLGRLSEDANFVYEVSKGLHFLGAPSADGLREALIQPAELAGYRYENPRMVDEMVHYLEDTPAGLPLLQFTATQLWEARDPVRKVLTEEAYQGLGGVSGALVSHADRVLARLSPSLKALCRGILVQLVGAERTRAVKNLAELREISGVTNDSHRDFEQVLDHLIDARLVVSHDTEKGAAIEIVHESLISGWPTLRRWLDESHEDGAFLEQVMGAARHWNNNRRAAGLLWGPEMVPELQRFHKRVRNKLPQVVVEFSQGVIAAAQRGTRRRRWTVAGALGALSALLAVAAVSLVLIRRSQLEAQRNAFRAGEAQQAALAELEERKRAESRVRELLVEREKEKAALETVNTELKRQQEELKVSEHNLKAAGDRLKSALGETEEQRNAAMGAQQVALAAQRRAESLVLQLKQMVVDKQATIEHLSGQLGGTFATLEK